MISLQLFVISVILGWIYFLCSRWSYYVLMLKVPGPKGYPFIGNFLELSRNGDIRLSFIESYFQKFGKAFLFWIGPIPLYAIGDPVLAQEILNSPDCVNKSSYIYDAFSDLIGHGLLTLKNPMWSKHRKLLNPAFKNNVLAGSLSVINNETKDFLKLIDSYVGKGEKDLKSELQHLILSIVTQTTMGSNVKEDTNFKDHSLMNSYEYILHIFPMLISSPWLKIPLVRKLKGLYKPIKDANNDITNFLNKMIAFKLDSPRESENSNKPAVFIDYVLAQLRNGNFTHQNVIDESYVVVLAAFETTAKVIVFTLTLLAMYPEYQEKLFDELQEMYSNTGDFEVTNEDLQNLNYLDRIINESMRLIPAAPMVGRRNIADVKLSNGVLIPKGTNIAISIFHIHRSTDLWGPEANIFNPDNFLPDNIKAMHPYSFIPFLKGIRNCIGYRHGLPSAKITLIKLLRNYEFTTKFQYEDLVFLESVSMKLEKYPLFELKRRSN